MKDREAPSLAAADEADVATLQQTVWSVAGHPHSTGSDLERVTCQSRIMKLSLITTLLLAPLTVLHAADFILVTKDTPPAPIIGFKGGTAYGETDEFGANAAVKPRQDQLQGKRNVHFMASGSAVLAKQVAEAITRELPKPASK